MAEIVTGSGPIWLSNQNPRLIAVDSISSPTEIYFYAKAVQTDDLMLAAWTGLAFHCGSGEALNAKNIDLSTFVGPAASTVSTDLLKGYKRLTFDLT